MVDFNKHLNKISVIEERFVDWDEMAEGGEAAQAAMAAAAEAAEAAEAEAQEAQMAADAELAIPGPRQLTPFDDDEDDDDDNTDYDSPLNINSFTQKDPFDGSQWENRLEYATKAQFLTGSAGTGKTYTIRQRMEEYEKSGKFCPIKLCATTGIAAVNMGSKVGTINSLLGYFDTASLKERYLSGALHGKLRDLMRNGFKTLVVDEVSMMSGQQLELIILAAEELAQKFGGNAMEIILTGDFCQLPPVGVDDKKLPEAQRPKWLFEASCWPLFDKNTTRLTKVWRQDSEQYVEALRAARSGDGKKCVEILLSLGVRFHKEMDEWFEGVTLRTKNQAVDAYNNVRMNALKTPIQVLRSLKWGVPSLLKESSPVGTPGRKIESQPADWREIPDQFVIREGMLAMILANDSPHYTYANGDTGTVVEIDHENGTISIELKRNGAVVSLPLEIRPVLVKKLPKEYKESKNYIDSYQPFEAMKKRIPCKADPEMGKGWVIGEVYYYPIRAAWATTVHKSQGLSMDTLQVDMTDNFFKSPAMAYVALSRCRTPEGLRLVGRPEDLASKCSVHPKVKGWL